MLLVIDIGNTNIKFGLFEGETLSMLARVSTDKRKTSDEFAGEFLSVLSVYGFKKENIHGCIISSVVPQVLRTVRQAIITTLGIDPLVVGPGIKTGLNIKIDNPASTGADLVTGCVAALHLYGAPAIVISMGTATTIIVLDEKGAMIGGAISPGVSISMSALSEKTALLPSVAMDAPKKVIGKNTDECIRSGVVIGSACMIDGMIDRINKEMGTECTVVATGGLAQDIVPACTHKIELRDDLMLQGLRIIYNKNK
ncbi:MAG: type III pantothenate kinase [Ruminococcaceae bacterium]|nr:type III pantothenate kinase [Oscillospiraceae bacterium]